MLEIEVKCRCPDRVAVEARLEGLGAEPTGEVRQEDVYYAHPCRDFGRTDESLRIRRTDDGVEMHYKGPKVDAETKTREEIGTPLESPEDMDAILKRIGFRPRYSVCKTRTTFLLDDVEVCLDRVEGLGDFVELEYQGQDLDAGKAAIMAMAADLGLEGSERRSYLALLHPGA